MMVLRNINRSEPFTSTVFTCDMQAWPVLLLTPMRVGRPTTAFWIRGTRLTHGDIALRSFGFGHKPTKPRGQHNKNNHGEFAKTTQRLAGIWSSLIVKNAVFSRIPCDRRKKGANRSSFQHVRRGSSFAVISVS